MNEGKVNPQAIALRQAFEDWYTLNAFDLSANPIGSRECHLQWQAWQAASRAAPSPSLGEPEVPKALSVDCANEAHNKCGGSFKVFRWDCNCPCHASPTAAQEQKPVARYELFKDGDAWCCVADEFTNLQECLAGFGQSPELALDDLIEKENSERERLGIPDYRKSPIPASGWVMVPKLVSDSMLTAALEKGFQGHESHLQILWTAMLAESAVAVGETK